MRTSCRSAMWQSGVPVSPNGATALRSISAS